MILDIIVVGLIGFLAWRGLKRGLIGSLILMFSFIISIIITWFAYPHIARIFSGSAVLNMGIILALFILCMIGLRFVAKLLKVITDLPIIKQVNALGGAAFGILRGALLAYAILALVFITHPARIQELNEQLPFNNVIEIPVAESEIHKTFDDMLESSVVASNMYNHNLIFNVFNLENFLSNINPFAN